MRSLSLVSKLCLCSLRLPLVGLLLLVLLVVSGEAIVLMREGSSWGDACWLVAVAFAVTAVLGNLIVCVMEDVRLTGSLVFGVCKALVEKFTAWRLQSVAERFAEPAVWGSRVLM